MTQISVWHVNIVLFKPFAPRAEFGGAPHPSQSGIRAELGPSAVCHFFYFSNRTISKGDILKNVKQSEKFSFLQKCQLLSVIEKL